jgi:probable HAF family extracellular repeat protein
MRAALFRPASVSALALAATLAVSTAPALAAGWSFVDIGALVGGSSDATSINDSGQVVGVVVGSYTFQTHAWIYNSGTITDLGTLGGTYAYPYAINSLGQVVGQSTNSSNSHRAFLWQNGTMADLGTFGGTSAYAVGINSAGQIAANVGNLAVFVNNDGSVTPLGTLGGTHTTARQINEAGQITGYSQTNRSRTDAPGNLVMDSFLFSQGQMIDAGAVVPGYSNYGYGVNSSGQIVGWTVGKKSATQAFVLSGGTASVFGASGSAAYGINDQGQIVGYNNTSTDGFLYQGGKTTVLDNLPAVKAGGFTAVVPERINNAGQIVGRAYAADGTAHAFLLSPTP